MNKVIVTTTINPPTEAILKYDAMPGWDLVVMGDLKTPADYKLENGLYVTPEEQEKYDKELSDAIGWGCIQRRNFGFLWAREMKADVVAIIDDDNIPYDGWGENLMLGQEVEVNYYETEAPVFDPVGATNHKNLWHRGFPLQLVPTRDYSRRSKKNIVPDVQADFWNGDPDIDAICRMTIKPQCDFDESCFPIASNKLSPFNSQNTFMHASLLKDYFLHTGVGRMDDIWASYYLEARGVRVVYGAASVFQARNEHDLVIDMKKEYPGYENNLQLVQDLAADPETMFKYIPAESVKALELYRKHF